MSKLNAGAGIIFPVLVLVLLCTAGCSPGDGLGRMIQQTFSALLGTEKKADRKGGASNLGEQDLRQINGEFVHEMLKTVLERDLNDEDELSRYMNVLDQGGHYDAVYNGVIYSAEYRAKEKGAALPPAIHMYALLMSQILLDQKFDPLSKVEGQPTEKDKKEAIAQAEAEGMGKPFYTLKRRLGEEVLKTIELKKEYHEKLATWFGRFTVFLNGQGVDFGFEARNSSNEYFHYKWALEADEDRLKWECLHRIHVLMNGTK